MLYCLNPACTRPENPLNRTECHGCGETLATSTQSYLFRVRFRITKCLGEGAFGRTYLAEDTDLMGERRVIKKLIAGTSRSNESKIRELFLREAQQLYHLNHPQIPKLYAYFEQDNAVYLVQDFVDGDNLFQEFFQSGIFSQEKIISLLEDLLPVLDYLHDRKIVHRDIKPHNIMRRRRTDELVLIDFGAAKQTSTQLQSQPGTSIYTPGYAAIEHVLGQPCPASDIYSLGATCVRLLTGCFPIWDEFGNTQDEIYDGSILEWRWRKYLHRQNREINEELENILDKMLARMVSDRYQSATQVLAAINSKLSGNLQLDPLFIERCQQELARCIGPMARFILQDTLVKNPQIQPKQLVEILSKEIPNHENAKKFKEHLS
jgi:serine/threonine protein kinase